MASVVNAAAPAAMTTIPKVMRDEKEVEYTPLGEGQPIRLSLDLVRRWLMPPTKQGKHPSDEDVMKFMMLCKTRELNPWVGDAFCVGYDGNDGPEFNLITSVQALFKRADAHPEYNGIESGIIVKTKEAAIEQRVGDWFDDGEKLLGGWARVWRKDRERPFEERIKLATFNKGRSVWKSDPEGMISKCAEAGALRKAFPTQLGGLYLREEFDRTRTIDSTAHEVDKPATEKAMDDLAGALASKRAAITHEPAAEDFSAKENAARVEREAAESKAEHQETKRRQPASQKQVAEPTEAVEPNIVADFERQIRECELEEEAKVLAFTILRSKALSDEQRRHLQRMVNDKVHSFN